ncbi:MAG: serine/threonine protein kinase [Deltaproteobacteria bacterium]|nr:serine/threonine protein kinase [Deltaproteobacteria bacterium]MDQ3298872.1 serine/threonine protein kinase [Myxococcota bacterium]
MTKRHRTADLEPTSFGGRYVLLRRLAIGGMAEIYLARQAAMAGFEKQVVIKRLRAELADDPRIVEMFLDEARIGALLNHPNIVHVYDVDEHDGIPYIAMEYIVGEELNELCRRGIQHDRFLPLEHAVELMRQAAAGLGYFHAKRGAEGTRLEEHSLEIVHLDISPTNLLVTQDGFLKVIDFGIANAKGQRQRTDVIPGKLGYMSPEQAARSTGPGVDHRSDIFSLGIVLYEITVGRRLFRGPAQEVVQRLIAAEVQPPTFARRNFPSALEAIVMRSLEKHPEDRYQSAYDLADDLETFLRDERLHSGPVRIARYLDMLTQAGGGPRRPELAPEQAPRDGDDLDFDRQVFEAFAPAPGAPGPEQAPEWEDTEQPENEIAAALGMELAELRALRTPVPTRPSGMMQITGKQPRVSEQHAAAVADDDGMSTNPVSLVEPGELAVPPAVPRTPHGERAPDVSAASSLTTTDTWTRSEPRRSPAPAPAPALTASTPVAPAAQRLPWVLVGLLGMAVLALVAYIVMT